MTLNHSVEGRSQRFCRLALRRALNVLQLLPDIWKHLNMLLLGNELGCCVPLTNTAVQRLHSGHPSLSAKQEAFPPLPGFLLHPSTTSLTPSVCSISSHSLHSPAFQYLSYFFPSPLSRLSADLHRPLNLLPLCCNLTRPSPPLLRRFSRIRS